MGFSRSFGADRGIRDFHGFLPNDLRPPFCDQTNVKVQSTKRRPCHAIVHPCSPNAAPATKSVAPSARGVTPSLFTKQQLLPRRDIVHLCLPNAAPARKACCACHAKKCPEARAAQSQIFTKHRCCPPSQKCCACHAKWGREARAAQHQLRSESTDCCPCLRVSE